jgi:hypothetical protein
MPCSGTHRHSLNNDLLDSFFTVFTPTLAAMTTAVNAEVVDQAFVAAGGVRGKEGEKLRKGPVFLACMRFSVIHRHAVIIRLIVDSLDGQRRPAHVPCLAFDGFPVGAIDGLYRMNVESGVVILRHQSFYHVTVQDFLLLQCVQKPGTETYGNRSRGTAFQLMKTAFPNKPGKHKRINMGMEVKQAAMGVQAEDPATHAGAELQAFKTYSCKACHALRSNSLPSLRLRRRLARSNLGMVKVRCR